MSGGALMSSSSVASTDCLRITDPVNGALAQPVFTPKGCSLHPFLVNLPSPPSRYGKAPKLSICSWKALNATITFSPFCFMACVSFAPIRGWK
eukprot:Skav225580  [mRNA]  locus=scaffold437:195841:196738:+ [translate_table: standard]